MCHKSHACACEQETSTPTLRVVWIVLQHSRASSVFLSHRVRMLYCMDMGECSVQELSTDQVERELLFWEQVRRHAVARQAVLVAEVDRRQVPLGMGAVTSGSGWRPGSI